MVKVLDDLKEALAIGGGVAAVLWMCHSHCTYTETFQMQVYMIAKGIADDLVETGAGTTAGMVDEEIGYARTAFTDSFHELPVGVQITDATVSAGQISTATAEFEQMRALALTDAFWHAVRARVLSLLPAL